MMKKLLILMLSMFTLAVCAQNVNITGKVVDVESNPLIGVYVKIKGTTTGTVTDMDGKFGLSGERGQTLVFSFLGLTTQEVVYNGAPLNITLKENAADLDEVVVIGYQTIRKADLTGAVSVVDTKEMRKSAAGTIATQMQGLATGVNVRSSGRAGEDASIEIRGVGTLSDRTPLWIVDGMIMNPGIDFNPSDIETIQVLKDASSAAIYGSRAANGVIIVTTKKGRSGPMKVSVNAKATMEWTPRYDLMDAANYKKYNDLAYTEGIANGSWNEGLQQHSNYDTNWQDAVFRTGVIQDYNVSLSGGGEHGGYFVSGGYFNHKGVSFGNDFDRYSFRVNTDGKKGLFSFGQSLAFSATDKDPLQTNPYNDVMRLLPTIPVYDENNPGGFGYGDTNANTFAVNPIARETLERQREIQHRLNGAVWLEFKPLPYLSYKLNAGIDYYFWEKSWFRGEGNWQRNQEHRNPEGLKERTNTYNRLLEHTVNFNKNFGKHHIDALAGLTYQTYKWETVGGSRLNFPLVGGSYLTVLDAGQSNQQNFNSIRANSMISYLGRFNYNYDNKYYLTGTMRRDGTSRLSKENRWGNFPSISGAWRISQEKFFNVSWIEDFKLRGNWGRLGNAAIGNWDYLGTINQSMVTVIGGKLVSAAAQVKIVNSDLKWETKETVNVGFDAAFLNQRLTASVEYYYATSRDILTTMPIAISTGNQEGAPMANAASLRNKGFEFTANWRDKIGEFNYGIVTNLTTLNNKVLDLGYGRGVNYSGLTKSKEGEPLSMYYLYKTEGIFKTQAQIDNYVSSNGTPILIGDKRPQLGDVIYVDTDDNAAITANDRQIVGNPWAKVQLALTFTGNWRNWDFSMMWYGQFGNDIYNVTKWQGTYFADNSNYLNFKKGDEPYQINPNSNTPRIIYGDARNTYASDRYLENGSFFRSQYIQMGYTFDKKLIKNLGIEALRVYATGSNLITFTKYSGLDPQFINNDVWDRGTDSFAFPNMGSVMFGLDLTF
ncbi:TonB-linked SusC/RagA family outer membrane protein [Dysgonomonas alginatilytica]|uniref:TonB-linked SusC/RagA family outer membrane protein n=1 Tax=Dysgonomonas alginatilytica TaxID=1605892 RepID=A0A2V3PIX8_9BACT|nr:TonB-dependent receptor [Dysgonomonas alginatilytica]PXV59994.1 TonB-linked SusC/RagA family outer membrane protein [Dysgonomonas alginatilytica]